MAFVSLNGFRAAARCRCVEPADIGHFGICLRSALLPSQVQYN